MRLPSGGLWRDRAFLRLWAAQSVSELGARFARDGLPLAAVLALHASPAQVGLLGALSTAPRVVVGLVAGGAVDRLPRRRVMIASDLLRAAVLAAVPLAAALHLLGLPLLYVVAALVGAGSVVFDIANQAYFPTLVGDEKLVEGNTKLSVTASLANVGGPAAAGVLIQALGAPVAVGVTSFSYLGSALLLARVRRGVGAAGDPRPEPSGPDRTGGIAACGRRVLGHELMGPILRMDASSQLFVAMFAALYPFIALRELHLTPALFGLTFALGGLGAVAGAAVRPVLARRLGLGPATLLAVLVAGLASLAIPLTRAPPLVAFALLAAAQFVGDGASTVSGVGVSSLRQTLFPRGELGRTGAVFQVAGGGAAMLGGLAGGALGSALGPRPAMLVAAAGLVASLLWGVASPLRTLRVAPAPVDG